MSIAAATDRRQERESTPQPVTPIGILAQRLLNLSRLADSNETVSETFRADLESAVALASGFERYVDQCTSEQSVDLARLAKRTANEDWDEQFKNGLTTIRLEKEMLSGHAEGQFLQMLVRATKATRVLEIGMFTGYASLAMAEGLPEDGRVIALEYDAFAANFAQSAFKKSKHGSKIEVVVGPAAESLAKLKEQKQTFDFVFIDADKTGYRRYLDALLGDDDDPHHLLSENCLICVDNTMLQGQPYLESVPTENGRAIAEFNELVSTDSRLHHVMVPLRDGITLIQKRTNSGEPAGGVSNR